MHPLAKLDRHYVWHPFTQMRDWLQTEPVVLVGGRGATVRDVYGREYLDANSSIWTNLHGHNHPRINAAIRRQLNKLAHSSALGLANEPASLLAQQLVKVANLPSLRAPRQSSSRRPAEPHQPQIAGPQLAKVFFSDDGSTAIEAALKLAYEFTRRTGRSQKPRFLSLENAYHGDTVGGVALGQIDLFRRPYTQLLFKTDRVMAPYCYRCPFNRAKPERADARLYRKCNWECLGRLERRFEIAKRRANHYAAFVFEPLMQGAAGMIPQPAGWLLRAAQMARGYGALLLADEVMTGFGRTGSRPLAGDSVRPDGAVEPSPSLPSKAGARERRSMDRRSMSVQNTYPTFFASHREGVQPDLLALAKGLTGGYLPMGATLTTQAIFDVFLGEHREFKTFFHGHSYTANQLGAAAALTSLEILQTPACARARSRLEQALGEELKLLWKHPQVGDIRQEGLIAGIELVKDWRTREPFDLRDRTGIRVCEAMAKLGVLTRPIGNVIVLMPPYCSTPEQVSKMVNALSRGIRTQFFEL